MSYRAVISELQQNHALEIMSYSLDRMYDVDSDSRPASKVIRNVHIVYETSLLR